MAPIDIFIEAIRQSPSLPAEVREHAAAARAVEESRGDESYIEFLDTQIQLEPRGPGWALRLRRRREALRPFCGITLLSGVVPAGQRHFSLRVLPEQRTVVHW